MPRYHSDSDSSDYTPRQRARSPGRRRPATPGPRLRARDLSEDRQASAAGPYAAGAIPARLQYEEHTPFYPPARRADGPTTTTDAALLAPTGRRREDDRPRRPRAARSSSSSSSSSSFRSPSRSRSHRSRRLSSAKDKAREIINSTFTPSTSGLGVGVLGAIVGGLAAREASEAVSNSHHGGGHHHHHGHGHEKRDDKGALLSTIVGAAVGGLGANAIEKKFEDRRSASREKDWERDRDRREGGRRSGEWRRY